MAVPGMAEAITQAQKQAVLDSIANTKALVDALPVDAPLPPVIPQPSIANFIATPSTVTAGQSMVLSATLTNVVSVTLNGQSVTLPYTTVPTISGTYTLVATGAPGSSPATSSILITVIPVTQPPVITDVQIHRIPIDLTAIVCQNLQYGSSRYERYQHYYAFPDSIIKLDFQRTNIAAGGTIDVPFAYPKYGLVFGDGINTGVERAICNVVPGTRAGTFVGTLGDEPDGPIFMEIVAYDAAGSRVTNPVESLVPWWAYIDRHGTAKDCADTIMQEGSFEWTHDELPIQYVWARVPKTMLTNPSWPLTPRTAVPFATALPRTQIARFDLTPGTNPNANQKHRPCTSLRGIVNTEPMQAYFDAGYITPYPTLPLLDGPRGVATMRFPVALLVGRNGQIYGCDGYAFWTIDATGTKRTLAGLRHKYAPYWEECVDLKHPALETLGNWDATIPAEERFPFETWGMSWDQRTLVLDPNAAPINGEQPHLPPGPTIFLTDRHGYILRVRFSPTDRSLPPSITRFIRANDPWGLVCDNAVLYVTERGLHRISKWNADTGAYLGDVISNPSASSLGSIQSRHFVAAPGVTLAARQAQAIAFPEGLALQDGYLYFGSKAQEDVRRINLANGLLEMVAHPSIDSNSEFVYLALSDGTFGPRGTVFVTTGSNNTYGRPAAYLPVPGVDALGTVTHSSNWFWADWGYYIIRGRNGETTDGSYAMACGIGHGFLVCGSSQEGLSVFCQADPNVDPLIDQPKIHRGGDAWSSGHYAVLHGTYGFGFTSAKLPWGVNPDIDYYLQMAGHTVTSN